MGSRLTGSFLGLLTLTAAPAASALLPPEAAETPPKLRICCALGYDLGLRVGQRKAPVGVHNVVEAGRVGHHRYRARSVFDEKNGLIHTCRAGFIDVGHLRSAADLYAHVFARLAAGSSAEPGEVIRFELEDGEATVRLSGPLDPSLREGVAQRIAFDLTVWHEIVTAVGGRTVPIFSEVFSALSPEDLYSDLVGTHLGAAAVNSPWPYDEAMQRLTQVFLHQAGAQDIAGTRAALDRVDGKWWRSEVPVPERDLLAVRNPSFGPDITPWRVPSSTELGCPEAPPLVVSRPDTAPSGEALSERYRLELVPPEGSRLGPGPFTPDEFEELVRRAEAALRQGPPSDPDDAETLAGIRVMPFRGFGGGGLTPVAGEPDLEATGGLEVIGARSEGIGGDMSIIRFAAAYAGPEQGLIMHITGIQADHLFFCTERGGARDHPPIAAWFQSCEPSGIFGVGGTLAQFQHDGATGRWVMRPVEAHVSFSLLDDAFDPAFERRHLILSTGISVESASTPGRDDNLSLRAHAQLRGRLASRDRRWQADLHLMFRQDLLDLADNGSEAGLSIFRRFILRDGGRSPVWAVTTVGLDLAATRWTQPEAALDDRLLPLTPTYVQDSLRAVITVGFAFERWVF